MYLHSLSLTNFRNYARLDIELSPHVVVLVGANAQGKTNLLEAIHYLAMGSSPLADADREMINWLAAEDTLPHARLVGVVHRERDQVKIEITLMQAQEAAANGRSVPLRKQIRVNGVNRRIAELVGSLHVVLFLPQDISLVDGSPGKRRRYMNLLLSQVDPRYYRALQQYGKVVYQRNHLLKRLRGRGANGDQLIFWDEQLVEHGAYLMDRRRWLIARFNEIVADIHPALTGGAESLRLEYRPSLDISGHSIGENGQFVLELGAGPGRADASLDGIREAFQHGLTLGRQREIDRGQSMVGPHRDDLCFLANDVDMNVYGSRGQQRTSALAVKLAEVEWLNQETGEMPVLLLDDMMSELDPERQRHLMATMARAQQVIVTATDIAGYPPGFFENATLYRVEAGRLRNEVL
jgi:DNA replication and repair protein RecF